MFLEPSFLIPASIIATGEIGVLVMLFYCLKGKISVAVDGPSGALWQREYEQKTARILFPLLLVMSLIADASGLYAYVKDQNEERAAQEMSDALRPILSKAVSVRRDDVCTSNGFIANSNTLEKDRVACAQVGNFRVMNQGLDRNVAQFFKVISETEVVQAVRIGYQSIQILDEVTTVEELKAVFSVK